MKKQEFKIELIDFTKLKDGSGWKGEAIKFTIVVILGFTVLYLLA